MKGVPALVLLLAGAALFAWSMPGDTADEPEAVEGPQAFPAEQEMPTDDLILPRAADGHFYAEVTVDGVPSRMLVDTGASVIALTGDDARQMGVEWQPEDVRMVARGAGGAVHGVHVTLDAVRLGDFEANGIDAVVVPEGLPVSLLGQSFLSRIGRVEIAPEEMTLGG